MANGLQGDTQNGVIPEITYCDVGTDVSEMFESISEHWATDQSSATVTLRCKWDERMIIIQNLLMRLSEEGSQSAEYPGDNQLLEEKLKLLDVDVAPFPSKYNEAGQGIDYEYAKLTLHYGTLVPAISYASTSEYWTINPGTALYYYDKDGNKVTAKESDDPINVTQEEYPGVLVFGHTLTITCKKINLEWFDLEEWEGKINKTEVNGMQFGGGGLLRVYPPGTLLCCAPSLTKHAVAGYYDATFTFNYRQIPWNKFYFPRDNALNLESGVVTMGDKDGKKVEIYPEVEMNKLFAKIGILTFSDFETEQLEGTEEN